MTDLNEDPTQEKSPPKGFLWVMCTYVADPETLELHSEQATDEDGNKIVFRDTDWHLATQWIKEKSGAGSGVHTSYANLKIIDHTEADCTNNPPSK
jgi:hypothetical protein